MNIKWCSQISFLPAVPGHRKPPTILLKWSCRRVIMQAHPPVMVHTVRQTADQFIQFNPGHTGIHPNGTLFGAHTIQGSPQGLDFPFEFDVTTAERCAAQSSQVEGIGAVRDAYMGNWS